jgi:hypothetical protein
MKTLLLVIAATGLTGCAVYPQPGYDPYYGSPVEQSYGYEQQPIYIQGGSVYGSGGYAYPPAYAYPRGYSHPRGYDYPRGHGRPWPRPDARPDPRPHSPPGAPLGGHGMRPPAAQPPVAVQPPAPGMIRPGAQPWRPGRPPGQAGGGMPVQPDRSPGNAGIAPQLDRNNDGVPDGALQRIFTPGRK